MLAVVALVDVLAFGVIAVLAVATKLPAGGADGMSGTARRGHR